MMGGYGTSAGVSLDESAEAGIALLIFAKSSHVSETHPTYFLSSPPIFSQIESCLCGLFV
jgi:hypothetical protein